MYNLIVHSCMRVCYYMCVHSMFVSFSRSLFRLKLKLVFVWDHSVLNKEETILQICLYELFIVRGTHVPKRVFILLDYHLLFDKTIVQHSAVGYVYCWESVKLSVLSVHCWHLAPGLFSYYEPLFTNYGRCLQFCVCSRRPKRSIYWN